MALIPNFTTAPIIQVCNHHQIIKKESVQFSFNFLFDYFRKKDKFMKA